MTDPEDLLRLVRLLATHPVLPPAETLPPNDDSFRDLLSDLARASGSSHAATLVAVSADRRVPVDELARRAQFLLTCLLMPASGTHYEVLGVAPDATRQQIRKRWASLMQRYHPDHLNGSAPGSNWLDAQARRLIEAYNTLKVPARRRAYDAHLAGDIGVQPSLMAERWRDRTIRFVRPNRWKWAPAGIAAVGIIAALWALEGPPGGPLPRVPLPPAPNLLDRWGTTSAEMVTTAAPGPQPRPSPGMVARRDGVRPAEPAGTDELPPLKPHLATVPSAGSASRSPTESSATPTALPEAVAKAPAAPPPPPSRAAAPPAAATVPPPVSPRAEPASVAAPVPLPGLLPAEPSARARLLEHGPAASQPGGTASARAVASAPPPRPVTPAVAAPSPPPPRTAPPAAAARSAPAPSAVAVVVPPSAATIGDAPARAEPLALIEAFRAGYERKDLTAVMALFGTEARDRDVAGRRAVEQLYVRNFAALDGIRYDLAQLGVRPLAGNGDLVVEGRFRIRATHLTDKPRPLDVAGPIRWLLRREDGALRIVGIEYEAATR